MGRPWAGFVMTGMRVVKSPGWDWAVDYESDDGVDVLTVFGVITVEEALLEARRSLSFNFFDADDFVVPAIVAIRRM